MSAFEGKRTSIELSEMSAFDPGWALLRKSRSSPLIYFPPARLRPTATS